MDEIKNYIIEIDSINTRTNSNYSKSIADGIIRRNDEVVGGYGIETLSNKKGDSIYKINYTGGIDLYISKTYYYKMNKLVFANFEITDSRNKLGTVYLIEEFYREKKKIYSSIKVNKLKENKNEANISLYEDAYKYLSDELNNSR